MAFDLPINNLTSAYAFLKASRIPSHETKTLPEPFDKGLESLLAILEQGPNNDERGLLRKIEEEITVLKDDFPSHLGLEKCNKKIVDLLEKGALLPFAIRPESRLDEMKAFLHGWIDYIIGQIFYYMNRELFGGWALKLDKIALEKEIGKAKLKLKSMPEGEQMEALKKALSKEKLERAARYEKMAEASKKSRGLYLDVGGERLSLETEDHVKLDGFYLSAQAFRQKLRESGAKRFLIDDAKVPFKEGLIVDKESPILAVLKGMHAFEMGWSLVKVPALEDKVLIVERSTLPVNLSGRPYRVKKILRLSDFHLEELPSEVKAGTVIVGSGSLAHYEANKKEMISFLMRGLNVMMINYRGYGESEGSPTTAGTYKDIEAAYQFLKAVKKTPDEEITGYGYCLSGQIMAELARRHPHINLYLDRTFSSIFELVLREGEKIVDRFFRRRAKRSEEENLLIARFIRAIVTPFIWMLAPAYSVLPALKTLKGRVHVMDAEGDLTVPKEDAAVMRAQMKKVHKEALFSHATLPKIDRPHFTQWHQISITRFKPPQVTKGLGIGEGMIPGRIEYPGVDQVEGFFKGLHQLRPILSSSPTA